MDCIWVSPQEAETREARTVIQGGSSEDLNKVALIRKARNKIPEGFKQSG